MTDDAESADAPDVPDWEDAYVDRVSDRLMFNYDLEKDRRVRDETYTLYGRMNLQTQKQFLHPSINYANHESEEHLFVQRRTTLSVADLERAVERAHDLADEWIVADETHFGTDFTYAFVVPEISDAVRSFVADFSDRTLIKYGYYGHYEISLIVVAPDREDIVASESADVAQAFSLWDDVDVPVEQPGFVSRLLGRLRR
ncbi:hypothetical protein [Haladaptatus sp. DJG-WS-42]|uniref:hypothetical protein n=1 Tax=Haladaptatus sp. DJG-WS-42 TaxID=3120516 RepID=UPI0030D27EA4